ncbi:NRDE family protein [Dasania sp. GY-MA-18]|uniref:NRDE family protein n=1 Tax=Dasania phycosphaerae TaxID=2950436 RepID=A0A9J6RKV2_9GAMM|nr:MULTISPECIES: NRDE family protein [Dasania]MCR8922193.1 NRDE family protein [Dasania sp. GY-MA-18]MCZ0864621.1 NRDE family protein [Dasania phycosphaerae]MCZ0868349.1 NRDE family protein [Dasania phycosphaerae]
MCLITFALQQHPDWPLIVLANRDEYYARATASAHFWQEQPQIFAGRDLQAGGTWLGINQQGQFAAVTNYRETLNPYTTAARSRGALSRDFLSGSASASEYLSQLAAQQQDYAGFNFICGNAQQLHYFSNRLASPQTLKPGIYGLSNGPLDSAWPKVISSKAALQQRLTSGAIDSAFDSASLIADMQDRHTAAQHLPNTGLSREREQLLSSRFIVSEDYGTRCTSVVLFHRSGAIKFVEQNYTADGHASHKVEQHISANAATNHAQA